jgi:hypothetical protein
MTKGMTMHTEEDIQRAAKLAEELAPTWSPMPRYVYDVCMLTERLQILVTPEQKRRLESEARTRGESIGGLVREAIEQRYGRRFSAEERMRAIEEIRAMPRAPFIAPEELNRLHAEEIEQEHPELFAARAQR